ncbi:TfdA family taurine catabolism dioxygenase TauD [Chitinophaga niastensis]|uniref:TfdA family taurine catabolism dioxygenase TauD n=1 Tax=Chitinophaga niastensis TaxID=536980 RepID=A0A2P8HFL8_CHINA|nr:TauD/TfdA family dioxygenase [Chitinophaga niastensis]PSL44991.1 TfdA family taurine catabolism dioxygenase TauD [Chitinophaga niastensis]
MKNSERPVVKENAVTKSVFDKNHNQILPLLIQPAHDEVDLKHWLRMHEEEFEEDLRRCGGILFRGFNIYTVEDFNNFMQCFNTEPLPYMFRSSPRKELDNNIRNIYTSTIYPNNRRINMHNESSYSRIWGEKIVFCCIMPPESGGETPIADSRRVLKDIDPGLLETFRLKGVKYRRNLLPDLGMPWQEVFQTNDIKVMEATCKQYNIHFEFIDKDNLVIEWVKKAIWQHPVTGEESWFNHALFFHRFSRYEELGLSHDEYCPPEYLTSETFFGDGSEISSAAYNNLREAYEKNIVAFPYQQGDIIFLDNMLAAHGRYPYTGERTIATAIINAVYDTENIC